MNKIIMIEGARNVGKTYLINSLENAQTYKFPFSKYFNESYTDGLPDSAKMNCNGEESLFYLTIGYDITILDLAKKGLLKTDLIVDRGILSDIIFAIQAGRIDYYNAIKAWNWLYTEYEDVFKIYYITTDLNTDNRNKDAWNIYDQKETMDLYNNFIEIGNRDFRYDIHVFKNNFDDVSVTKFRNDIDLILNGMD